MIKANGGGKEEEEEGWFRDDESRADGRQLFRRATILQFFSREFLYFIFNIFFFFFYRLRTFICNFICACTIDLNNFREEILIVNYKKKKKENEMKLIR